MSPSVPKTRDGKSRKDAGVGRRFRPTRSYGSLVEAAIARSKEVSLGAPEAAGESNGGIECARPCSGSFSTFRIR